MIDRREFMMMSVAGIGSETLFPIAEQASAKGTIHVNVAIGSDSNSGTRQKPLKTLSAAAKRVNIGKSDGPTTIVIAEGIYTLDRTVLLKPDRPYTRTERLTIRAESLPDDADWRPERMPVLLPVMPLSQTDPKGQPDPFGGYAYGVQVESSHVTIQGLKILGTPHYEFPGKGQIHRVYPIAREGDSLDDLEITQCLFAGDPVALPLHLGILANGHGLVVDHCVFYRSKLPVVFWNARGGTANGDAMRYCLVIDNYGCGVWTSQPGSDFEFRNNIISGCLYAWIRSEGSEQRRYKAVNSIFAGNKYMAGSGAGPALNFKLLDPKIMELDTASRVLDKPVEVELDETKRTFLHIVEGSTGGDLHAGLFRI